MADTSETVGRSSGDEGAGVIEIRFRLAPADDGPVDDDFRFVVVTGAGSESISDGAGEEGAGEDGAPGDETEERAIVCSCCSRS